MDEKLEEQTPQQFGDPELNNEPEIPIIPAPEKDPEPEAAPAPSYAPTTPKKRNPKNLLYLLAAIVVIVVLFNAFKILTGGSKKSTPTPTPAAVIETATPEPSATESASPTPTPTNNPVDSATGLNRANLSVEIQNGSGTVGAAGKASTLLKSLGYNITSTGNADNFNFTDVTVKVKVAQKKYLPLLIKDLSTDYTIGASSSDLDASSSADALVIIGK